MNKRDWRIAWSLAGALTGTYVVASGASFVRWQAEHPWWAQAFALVSFETVIAGTIWVVIHERAKRREKRCED